MFKLKSLLKESVDDNQYLSFIQNNNLDSAQKLVNTYAKSKGYVIGPVKHITNNNFTKFDFSKLSKSAVWGPAIYGIISGNWKPGHLSNGKVLNGFVGGKTIDITKPLDNDAINIFSKLIGRNVTEIPFISLEKRFGSVSSGLSKAGYSSAIHEGPGSTGTHIAIFDPKMFKLSDVITYDDNKKIIPISQRFNSSNDDIRY